MRILYIDIDSQRPDHLGCYGYHRNTSPAMDAIAAEGTVLHQCYTPDAPCLPSRTAFYSGRFGIQTGVVGHSKTAAQPKVQGTSRAFRDWFCDQGLAHQLQRLGFHTAMISPFGQRHAAHWFYAGFNEVHNTGKGGMESAEEVQPVVDKWLADNVSRDNWYLHINYWDPHTPYRVPADYGEPFANDPLPAHLDDDALIERHKRKTGPHSALDLGMYDDARPQHHPREVARINNRQDMRHWINGYDTAVRYVDDKIATIVAALKAAGVYEQTAIIISADHGENQGELGIYGEHGTADAATCRVPMIIRWPGAPGGRVDHGLHYNLDLAPTLMDLLGGQHQPIWDGRSFASAITSQPTAEADARTDLVISQCCHVCQRSVRWDEGEAHRWLYIRTYHDGFHLFPQEMLFDLAADPYEQNDLAASLPAICREGAWRLARWHDDQMRKMAHLVPHDVTDPLWTVIAEGGPTHASPSHLPPYLKRLEETGRAEGAAALRERHKDLLGA